MRFKFWLICFLMIAVFAPAGICYADLNNDADADSLTDDMEIKWGTDLNSRDTDGDGFLDGEEVIAGYSPVNTLKKKADKVDSDKDGLNDLLEVKVGTLPNNADTDSDGKKDGDELNNGKNPLDGLLLATTTRSAIVDLSKQKLKYFFNGIEIGSMPVSTGVIGMETPKGDFTILKKLPLVNYRGLNYNYPNTKWNLRFKESYYLHGAFWHNQFGIKPMSHGCVNIGYKDAEKLYKFLQEGDPVKIVGETPRYKPQKKVVKQ